MLIFSFPYIFKLKSSIICFTSYRNNINGKKFIPDYSISGMKAFSICSTSILSAWYITAITSNRVGRGQLNTRMKPSAAHTICRCFLKSTTSEGWLTRLPDMDLTSTTINISSRVARMSTSFFPHLQFVLRIRYPFARKKSAASCSAFRPLSQ